MMMPEYLNMYEQTHGLCHGQTHTIPTDDNEVLEARERVTLSLTGDRLTVYELLELEHGRM